MKEIDLNGQNTNSNPFAILENGIVPKAEKILWAIALASIAMYFTNLPFAGPLKVISLSTLAMLYSYTSYYIFRGSKEQPNIRINWLAGIALAISLVAVLFKLMIWPNAALMLMVAIVALAGVTGFAYWKGQDAEEETKQNYTNILIRTVLVLIVVLGLYMTPTVRLLTLKHPDDPELVRLKVQSYEHPANEAYRKELQEYTATKRAHEERK